MTTQFTRRDYMALPEGYPAQLIEGCLVRQPAPRYGHQLVASDIYSLLLPIVGRGHVISAPADVPVDEFNVYQPDVCVLGEVPPLDAAHIGIPRMAFEVLTPSTARYDRHVKRARLLDAGVEEVWIVDPVSQSIDVFDRNEHRDVPRTARGDDAIASLVLPAFSVVPAMLFAPPESQPT